ncbi:MAG: hypothetical protein HZB42_09240 [Sphingobacteriales bacterium]|nr:hypothetical protein [Sphingobacteriales bacterium]
MDPPLTTDLIVESNSIEKIMDSLNNIKRAEAPPFLYGMIQAKLMSPEHSLFERFSYFISRPVMVISLLSFILFIDRITLQSAYAGLSAKSLNTTGEIPTMRDESDEVLFYDIPGNEYVYIYL